MNSKSGGLGFERRATATAACRVRVSDFEARIVQRIFVVELAAAHERKALGIHKDAHAMLRADVPLAEMFGYSTAIRTVSQGRANYSMTPSHFDPVPNNIVDQIVEQRGGNRRGGQ